MSWFKGQENRILATGGAISPDLGDAYWVLLGVWTNRSDATEASTRAKRYLDLANWLESTYSYFEDLMRSLGKPSEDGLEDFLNRAVMEVEPTAELAGDEAGPQAYRQYFADPGWREQAKPTLEGWCMKNLTGDHAAAFVQDCQDAYGQLKLGRSPSSKRE